jgi:hypothetical protein
MDNLSLEFPALGHRTARHTAGKLALMHMLETVGTDGAVIIPPLLEAIGPVMDLGTSFLAIDGRHIPHGIRLAPEAVFEGPSAVLSAGDPARLVIMTHPKVAMPPLAGQIS